MTGESVTSMTPEEKYALWQTLATDPGVQAQALHDRMVRNQQLEAEWNAKIAVVDSELRILDGVAKVLPYGENLGLMRVAEGLDLRNIIRKYLFDKKLRLQADRDIAVRGF